jgi:PAS domain S-box-containing protein
MAHAGKLGLSAEGLLEGLGDAVFVVDPDGVVVHSNAAAASLTGYPVEELVGMSVEELVPARLRRLHETHREDFRARSSPARPMGPGLDLCLVRSDGREIPVDISLSPLPGDGAGLVLAAARDVTERRQAEIAARQQAELLELAHDCILVRRATDSALTFWNQGAVATYGFSRREALDRVSHELLATVFPEPLAEVDRSLTTRGRWEGELLHRRKDGRTIQVASRQVLMRDCSGTPQSVLEINRDITQLRRQQRQVEAALALAAGLLAGEDLDAVLTGAARRLRSLVAADWVVVATTPGEGSSRVRLAEGDRVEMIRGLDLAMSAARVEALLRSGRPELLASPAVEGQGGATPAPKAEGSTLVVPVTTGDRAIGILAVGRASAEPELGGDDLGTVQSAAAVMALAVDHVRLRDELRRVTLMEDRERFGRQIQQGVIRSLFEVALGLQATFTMTSDPVIAARIEQAMNDVDGAVRDLRATLFAVEGSPASD